MTNVFAVLRHRRLALNPADKSTTQRQKRLTATSASEYRVQRMYRELH